ncbi:MAG: hypothetical protein WBY71_00990 [Nitrososphaeraceae archaeon]
MYYPFWPHFTIDLPLELPLQKKHNLIAPHLWVRQENEIVKRKKVAYGGRLS